MNDNDNSNILDFPKKPEVPYLAVPTPRRRSSEDGYSIGPADAPYVCSLKVACNGTTTTLTLTDQGVLTMIRLLEATLETDDDDGPVSA